MTKNHSETKLEDSRWPRPEPREQRWRSPSFRGWQLCGQQGRGSPRRRRRGGQEPSGQADPPPPPRARTKGTGTRAHLALHGSLAADLDGHTDGTQLSPAQSPCPRPKGGPVTWPDIVRSHSSQGRAGGTGTPGGAGRCLSPHKRKAGPRGWGAGLAPHRQVPGICWCRTNHPELRRTKPATRILSRLLGPVAGLGGPARGAGSCHQGSRGGIWRGSCHHGSF